MSRSHAAFERIVWPKIKPACDGGYIVAVEGATDDMMAKQLDALAGIDFWHIKPGEGIRGLATRVQVDHGFRTFTVRVRRDSGACTELEKRENSIASARGWIYPHLTCHAYIDGWGGPLAAVGLAKTTDVMWLARESPLRRTANAWFAHIQWDAMRRRGIKMFTWEHGHAMGQLPEQVQEAK